MTEKELSYYYWLHTIPGVGNKTIRMLRSCYKSPEQIYYASEKELSHFLNERQKKQIKHHKESFNLSSEYQKVKEKQINMYPINHPNYPKRLKNIPDSPEILYVRGNLPPNDIPTVAIIGARMCSQYGRYMAREFGMKLACAGIPVISGMALGVDGIAQRAALNAGGDSYAVLGSGVDVCYPGENQDIYRQMHEKGGIISEYPPGTQPKPGNFPPRNRIISGLSDTILVIEAKEKSGTLITVDMALEQGKEVFALPGRVTDSLSHGCNKLILQGAGIATSPEAFLEEIMGCCKKEDTEQEKIECYQQKMVFLTVREEYVLQILDVNPMPIHQILLKVNEKTEMSIPELMDILMSLCMKQQIMQIENHYMLKKV